MKNKGKVLSIIAVTGFMVLINTDMSVLASDGKNPAAAREIIQTEVVSKSTTYQLEEAMIAQEVTQTELTKSNTVKLNKLLKEVKATDKLKVKVEDVEKQVKSLGMGEVKDIDLIAQHFTAEKNINNELKAVKQAQKEEAERIAKEKAEAERKAQEEAARKAAQSSRSSSRSTSSSSNSGSSNTSSGSSHSAPKSKNGTYTDWMWRLINSYPEPARRGLRGATVVNSLGGYAGMTYTGPMTIEVALGFRDATFRGTVAHEIGHIYHVRTGADQTAEWYEIFQAEWAGKGYYGSNNVMEAFADTFKSMYEPGSYGARPTSSIPRSVNYIRNLLNSGV